MSFDGAAVQSLFDQVVSYVQASGLFDRVNQFEPKASPGSGLSAMVWVQSIDPEQAASGLASTSGRVVLNIRVFTNMLAEPPDAIDPNVLTAVTTLIGTFSGDLHLGSTVRNVDLLGETGESLSAQAGYLNLDGTLYRVMTLVVPIVINDMWSQS